jgi:hypothetical protein
VPESVEEHHIVVWLLSELAKLDPSDETYDAKGTVLIENSATTSRKRSRTGSPRSARAWAERHFRSLASI